MVYSVCNGANDPIAYRSRFLCVTSSAVAMVGALAAAATPAQAQVGLAAPDTLVSVCSGVSLPRSVVTDIMGPVVNGIYAPVEGVVNDLLLVVDPLTLGLLPGPLSVNVTGLLNTAASGSNIGVQVVAADGSLVGPSDQCDAAADSYTLDNPAGIAIGGNQITGLGATGQQALAGEINSVAMGNNAETDATAAGAIAIGPNATVGAGATGSIALGSGASATGANSVALGAGSVAARSNVVEVGGRQVSGVAAGTVATDAVNLGQLNAATADAVQYDDSSHTLITLDGAGGTRITNVLPGAVTATSTDAVNGAQLFGLQTQVDGIQTQVTTNTTAISNLNTRVDGIDTRVTNNTTAITNLNTRVDGIDARVTDNTTAITNLDGRVTANTTAITNLDARVTDNTTAITNLDGRVTDNSTAITNLNTQVAGNITAISNLSTQVAGNTTAITNLELDVMNGAIGPVQYSNAATPTVPNGGTPTNHVTLIGAAAGPVGLHNVAAGVVAAGSTDAVNGGQVFALFDALPDSVANAVTYDDSSRTLITLNSGGPATVIRNVAAGTAATDAVNVGQLNNVATNVLNQANSYTDLQFDLLGDRMGRDRGDARSGTSAALAAAGMPQAAGEGRTMIAGGVGTYRGKAGFAIGASHRAANGKSVYKIGVTYDSSESLGANAGVGFEF